VIVTCVPSAAAAQVTLSCTLSGEAKPIEVQKKPDKEPWQITLAARSKPYKFEAIVASKKAKLQPSSCEEVVRPPEQGVKLTVAKV
jgi:hypothetical protein